MKSFGQVISTSGSLRIGCSRALERIKVPGGDPGSGAELSDVV